MPTCPSAREPDPASRETTSDASIHRGTLLSRYASRKTNDGGNAMSWNEEARIACSFRFKCPKVWQLLQPTAVQDIRHCPECQRDVHLALTEETFRKHSDEGRCIAVPVLLNSSEGNASEPIYWIGEVVAPYNGSLKRVNRKFSVLSPS